MELGKKIKFYRQEAKISQEDLANRIYVSRQTVSNWENDRSYPDVNSLVLLSEIFQISLDKLIKGDIELMKGILKEEIKKFIRYRIILTILLIAFVVLTIPFITWLKYWALIPLAAIFSTAIYCGLKVERIKNDNDIYSYKEIVAFCDGKRLDEIQKQREIGKRPYQKILFTIGNAVIAFLVCLLIGVLFRIF